MRADGAGITLRAPPFVRPALLALTLGLLGSAGAQSGAATPPALPVASPTNAPAFCNEDRELYVDLEVGGRNRGTRLVYPEGEALWVEAAALTPSETGYVAAQEVCGGVAFVRLSSALRTRLDEQALSLTVEAAPALLGTTTYRVGTGQVSYASDLPLLRLNYSVAAAANVSRVETLTSQAVVQYWQGNVRLQGGVRLAGGQGRTPSLDSGAQADYDLTPSWQVGAFANAGSGEERFGVRSSLSRTVLRDVGPIELDFSSDAQVQVTVDGETRAAFLAPAGHLVLTDVRAKYTSGTVAVRWTDGVREGQRTFPYRQASVLQSGSFGVTGEVAWNTRAGLEASVQGRYVLTPQVNLQAGFEQTNGAPRASFGTVWQGGDQGASLNVSTDFGVPPSGTGASADMTGTRVQAGYTARSGPVTFGLSSTWTGTSAGTDPRRSEIRLVGAYNRVALGVYASVAYSLSRELSGRVGLDYRPTPAALLSASADLSRESVRLGVRGRFTLGAGRAVTAEARPGQGFAAEYTQAIDNDLLRLSVQNLAPNVTGTYTLNRGISATASVNSLGQGTVSAAGSVSRVAGQVTWNSARDGAVLFLKTGVPDLMLRVNGQPQGRTDATGKVVLTGFRPGLPLQLSFDPSELPIEVSYRQDRVGLLPDRAGVNELDWRENFTLSRWVILRWADGRPAAEATLEVAGQVFTADDEGTALLPPLPAGVPATLRSEDGVQRCNMLTGPKGEVPTCGS